MEKKRVAFIVSTLDSGGIENYLLRFLSFYQNNLDAVVFCKLGITGELYEKYIELGFKVVPIKIGYFDFISWFKLYKYLVNNNYRSICDFTGNFSGIPLILAFVAKIEKRIAFYRGSTDHFTQDKFRILYNKGVKYLVTKYATNILSNSYAALDYFFPERNKNDIKFKVIYNGINSEKFCSNTNNLREELGIHQDDFVVGHVGRFDVSKNHETLIEVAIALCSSFPDLYFVFCGKGVEQNLSKKVNESGLQSKIKFLGYRNDVDVVLNTFDSFYFPSITEGQPNALIEAMVKGLPFVASNIPSIVETVPNTHSNQLISPRDISGAVSKLTQLYQNKELRRAVSCSEWAREEYCAEKCFQSFYNKL